jgi:hypothetical protein
MHIKLLQEWSQVGFEVKRPKACHHEWARASRDGQIRKVPVKPLLQSSA